MVTGYWLSVVTVAMSMGLSRLVALLLTLLHFKNPATLLVVVQELTAASYVTY